MSNRKTIFVGMSGGVDSSVSAYLLKRQGYNVIGVFMRCVNIDGCAEADAEDARRVAGQLGIPFYVWDFEKEYEARVVQYMLDGYRAGITPNPDVMCNREVKFGLFLEKAIQLGADGIATGHYVRKVKKSGRWFLQAAVDTEKDQSYFLWTLTSEQIGFAHFPIGEYKKSEVRAIAKKAGLYTAEKKDSQGICFLGKISLGDYLKTKLPMKAGAIVTTTGQTIGTHDGSWFYTIGQRHGLNLQDKQHRTGIRGNHETGIHYVAAKDITTNTIVVAEGGDNPALYHTQILLSDSNLGFLDAQILCARVRYRQPVSEAQLVRSGKKIRLIFTNPQKFVAIGQSVVVYDKEGLVYGGGIIQETQ